MSCSLKIKALNRLKEDGVLSSSREILDYNRFNRLNELYTETAVQKYGLEAGESFLFDVQGDEIRYATGSSFSRDNKITKYRAVPNDDLFNELEQLVANERSLEKQGEVDYRLKSVEILSSKKGIDTFEKGRKHNWSLSKILTELQIPKAQKDIILNKELSDREEILLSLLADNTFTVEINTATRLGVTVEDPFTHDTPENTDYYSNLTVPGGTNYTENEISTPDITPSIKGHAEFSTHNGIGWFRSDVEVEDGTTAFEMGADDFFEGDYNTKIDPNNVTIGGTPTKTRRVLEFQSDLFQKGRGKDDLIGGFKYFENVFKADGFTYKNPRPDYYIKLDGSRGQFSTPIEITKEEYESKAPLKQQPKELRNKNEFIQLLNEKNNWTTFFIQSIVQDSINKGYNTVLFPKGNTASKIEGHETLEDIKRNILHDIETVESGDYYAEMLSETSPTQVTNLNEYQGHHLERLNHYSSSLDGEQFMDGNRMYYLDSFTGEYWYEEKDSNQEFGKSIFITAQEFEEARKNSKTLNLSSKKTVEYLNNKLQFLEREGLSSLKPIYNFYENTTSNILNKLYTVEEYTDDYGNTWSKVDLVAEKLKNTDFRILLKELNDSKTESPGSDFLYSSKESKASTVQTSENTDVNYESIADLFGGDLVDLSVNEFLRNALYSLDLNDTTKAMIRKLLTSRAQIKFTDNLKNANTIAQYDPATRTIYLNRDKLLLGNNYHAFETVLHEIAHDMSVNAIENPKNDEQRRFKAEMTALYNYYKSRSESDLYGFKSVHEFIAEVFSNPIFRAEIDSINLEGGKRSLLQRILDSLSKLFGISSKKDSSAIVQEIMNIGMMEYSSNNIYASESTFILEKQEENTTKEKYRPEFTKELRSLDDVIKNILSELTAVSNRSAYKRGKKDDNTKRFDEARASIRKLASLSTTEAIYKYVEFSNIELFKLNRSLQNKLRKGDKITSDYLYRAKSYTALYSSLSEIKDILNNQYSKGEISKDAYERLNKGIGQANENFANFKSMYLNEAKEHVVDRFWESNTKPTDIRKIQLEKEWNATKPSTNKERWVYEKLEEERDVLEAQAREDTRRMLDDIPFDIHSIESYITSEKNLPNLLIKMFSATLDKADMQVRDYTTKMRVHMTNKLKEYNPQGSTNEQKFGKLVSQDNDGQYYFIDRYQPEFIRQFNDLIHKRFLAREEFGKHSKEYKQADLNFVKWTNTNIVRGDNNKFVRPVDKWKDPRYDQLNTSDKVYLNFLKQEIKYADKDTLNHKTLIQEMGYTTFIKLPSIRQSDLNRILSGDVKGYAKDKLEDFTGKVQQDRTEGGELNEIDNHTSDKYAKVLSTVNNEERFLVPIHYRAKVTGKDQSLDLPTIVLMNSVMSKEYSVKQELESDSNLLMDVVGAANVYRSQPISRKTLVSAFSKDMMKPDLIRIQGSDSNIYKKLNHMMQNRIYNILDVSTGKMTGDKINIISQNILGYTANMTLALNWLSAVPNMFQGKIQNFIEAVGYDTFSKRDLIWAEKTYWRDMMTRGGLNDIGARINSSKINLMIDKFNVLTEFSAIKHDFEKDTKFKALFNTNSLHAFNNMAEHYAQSTLMLAIMSNIKVMNNKGEYLDSNGNVVADKKLAMNLYDAFEVKDGELILNNKVSKTSFNPDRNVNDINSMVQIENLIKSKVIDLHGQYNSKIQSTLQRYWFGKAIMMFRKWLIPGFYRRWRGSAYVLMDGWDVVKGKRKQVRQYEELEDAQQYYSLEQRKHIDGTYSSFLRFMFRSVLPGMKQFKLELITADWKNLSDHQKANIHKTVTELSITMMTLAAAYILAGMAADAPDEDKKKMLYTFAYFFKRQESELMQYYNPADLLRIFRTPFASINTVEKSIDFMNQIMPWNIDNQYEKGRNADEYKAWVKLKRLLPVISQTERDAQRSFNYLENLTSN